MPPLDLDVEDHGTLAVQTVLTTRRALEKLELVLAVEAFLAVDDLGLRDPLPALGAGTRPAYDAITDLVSGMDAEALAATAVERARELLVDLAELGGASPAPTDSDLV